MVKKENNCACSLQKKPNWAAVFLESSSFNILLSLTNFYSKEKQIYELCLRYWKHPLNKWNLTIIESGSNLFMGNVLSTVEPILNGWTTNHEDLTCKLKTYGS